MSADDRGIPNASCVLCVKLVYTIVYDLSPIFDNSNTFKQSLLWFPTHFGNMVHTLESSFINKCVPKWDFISLTLFGLQYDL